VSRTKVDLPTQTEKKNYMSFK